MALTGQRIAMIDTVLPVFQHVQYLPWAGMEPEFPSANYLYLWVAVVDLLQFLELGVIAWEMLLRQTNACNTEVEPGQNL